MDASANGAAAQPPEGHAARTIKLTPGARRVLAAAGGGAHTVHTGTLSLATGTQSNPTDTATQAQQLLALIGSLRTTKTQVEKADPGHTAGARALRRHLIAGLTHMSDAADQLHLSLTASSTDRALSASKLAQRLTKSGQDEFVKAARAIAHGG
jgi:hypothetical protein